jgi:hypothetical protein
MSLPVDKIGLDDCTVRMLEISFQRQSNLLEGKINALHELQWVACSELIKNV